jgi:hypothetical protein
VDEERIQVVDVPPPLEEPREDGVEFGVSIEEGTPERGEERNEGQLDLWVPPVNRGIENPCDSVAAGEDVGGPDIAVQELRVIGFVDQVAEAARELQHAFVG